MVNEINVGWGNIKLPKQIDPNSFTITQMNPIVPELIPYSFILTSKNNGYLYTFLFSQYPSYKPKLITKIICK